MNIKNLNPADWKLEELATANNKLNESYFVSGEYKKIKNYTKFGEYIKIILKKDKKRPLKLLDIGCGSGWHGVYLKKENLISSINYNGIDISEHMCNKAKNNFPNGKFVVFDITKKNFNKYDIIFESAVIELVHDWESALINILKSSSSWVIFHRMFFKEGKTFIEQVSTYNSIPDIRIHIGLDDFNTFLKNEGFEIIINDIWIKQPYSMGSFLAKRR